jgi:hypothetical protein
MRGLGIREKVFPASFGTFAFTRTLLFPARICPKGGNDETRSDRYRKRGHFGSDRLGDRGKCTNNMALLLQAMVLLQCIALLKRITLLKGPPAESTVDLPVSPPAALSSTPRALARRPMTFLAKRMAVQAKARGSGTRLPGPSKRGSMCVKHTDALRGKKGWPGFLAKSRGPQLLLKHFHERMPYGLFVPDLIEER